MTRAQGSFGSACQSKGHLFVVLVALASACIDHIAEETSTVGELTSDCVVPVPDGVRSLAAPASLEYPDGSLWIWRSLDLADGQIVPNASAFVSDANQVCGSGVTLELDASGAPASLLALTPQETQANAARTDGRQLALVPFGGYVYAGQGYLFYDHALLGPGIFDEESLGTGLCVRADQAVTCDRVTLNDDTILWQADQRILNSGGLVVDDRALVYGCRPVASFSTLCTVSGAPLDALEDPSAYEVYNAFNGWVDQLSDASALADELGPVTVSAFSGTFMATILDIFESRFYVRRMLSATGDMDRRIAIFDALPPASWFLGGGREHSGLRRSPRTIHVSYSTSAAAAPGLHLATFRFFGELGGPYQ
ncbi:MAG: hypothetical protein WCG85_22950 [Polyangia bacterium]